MELSSFFPGSDSLRFFVVVGLLGSAALSHSGALLGLANPRNEDDLRLVSRALSGDAFPFGGELL
jgi:hypothetical protein